MCDPISITLGVVGATAAAVGTGVSVSQSKKAAKAQAKATQQATEALSAANKATTSGMVSKTAQTLEDNSTTSSTQRTIGSLRIPLKKTSNDEETGINTSSDDVGLNITGQ